MDPILEITKDMLVTIVTGGWIAFAGFGVFLAYKLAFTGLVSWTVIKSISKIIDAVCRPKAEASDKYLLRLASAAGMTPPLSLAEWEDLISRVKK